MGIRNLPNRMTTESVYEYCDKWAAFAKPVEHALGWRVSSCDPGYVFDRDLGNGKVEQIRLSVEAVGELCKLIAR